MTRDIVRFALEYLQANLDEAAELYLDKEDPTDEDIQNVLDEMRKSLSPILLDRDMLWLPFRLSDLASGYSKKITGMIGLNGWDIRFIFNGYTDATSHRSKGYPVVIELYENHLRTLTWPDVNEEDPTIVDMEGARDELVMDDELTEEDK